MDKEFEKELIQAAKNYTNSEGRIWNKHNLFEALNKKMLEAVEQYNYEFGEMLEAVNLILEEKCETIAEALEIIKGDK